MAVSVTSRVHGKVSSLVIERNGNIIKAAFKVPASMSGDDKYDRATWIDHELRMDRSGVKPVGLAVGESTGPGMQRTDADRFWIRGHSMSAAVEKSFDRSRYHPVANGRYCKKVSWGTFGGNIKAGSGWGASMQNIGPVVWATRTVGLPRKPVVSWTYDQEQSKATVTIKTDAGKDWNDRYDTMYQVTLRRVDGKEVTLRKWTASRATEITATFDLTPYMGASMAAGKYVTIKCQAYARGMAGDNPGKANAVTASRSVFWPSAATLGTVRCSSKSSTGRITVPVTPGKAFASSTQLQLQRRHGADGNWEDVSGATDNGDAKALYDTYADAAPVAGEYIYYRVKSTRDQFTQYSAAKRADCLYTALPKEMCSATCKLASITSNSAGTAFTVVMAWKDSTANTGCELSMSELPGGWNATDPPTAWQVTGEDGTSKLKGWHTKTYLVSDSSIEPGGTYYFRMRRYKTYSSGNTRYSAYDLQGKATPAKAESAADDKCCILSISTTGTNATVTVGINEDNVNDGTEITWADNPNAWRSNEQPNLFNATWARSANTGSQAWPYKQTIYLRGLAEGKTYWVRARRYKADTYSGYSATKQFSIKANADTAEYDPRCGLVSVTDAGDGESAVVVVGWSGDRTGCEVSWSTDANAWESSDEPQSTKFDWRDATRKSTAWAGTSTLYLRGLTEGETYYVRARTYFEAGNETAWSDYTADMTVTPHSAPDAVTLSAPDAVARGEAIECWWSISGDMEQRRWKLHRDGYAKKALASGTGSLCHASVPASKYKGLDSIDLFVDASTGGAYTRSNVVSVGIADYPSCEAACAATLTVQPAAFEAYTDNDAASLLCTLRADGVTVSAPDGDRDQLPGDVVWTERVTPAWTSTTWGATALYAQLSDAVDDAQDAYDAAEAAREADPDDEDLAVAAENAATALADATAALAAHPSSTAVQKVVVTLPDALPLWDGAGYTLSVQTVEPVAGLVSGTATCHMDVEWAHQAVNPAATLTVDSEERSVAIVLGTPNDTVSTDVCDVYRTTPAGHELVAESIPMGGELADPYAPFGTDDLHYRIALRTVDGDFAFDDFPYVLKVGGIRFDWDGRHVELPWNVQLSESYSKDFETRSHADGSTEGYFGPAVGLTGSFSTDLIKVDDAQLRLVRELGSYPGAVFCRTSAGTAFQCNVNVSELSMGCRSGIAAVSLDVTRVALTEQFKCNGGETVTTTTGGA